MGFIRARALIMFLPADWIVHGKFMASIPLEILQYNYGTNKYSKNGFLCIINSSQFLV